VTFVPKRSVKVLTGNVLISKKTVERMQGSPGAFTAWADDMLAEAAAKMTAGMQASFDEVMKQAYMQPLMDAVVAPSPLTIDSVGNDFLPNKDDTVLDHAAYERLLALWRMARDGSSTAAPLQREARGQLGDLLSKHGLNVSVIAACKCATVDALADLLAPAMAEKSTVDDDNGRFGSRVTGGPAVDAGIKSAFGTASLRS
jgi:hypothetical protein